MVGVMKRMRKLKELLDIRLGPGALVMSRDVKRVHMSFALRMNQGHMGPRKFWRNYLPRLKYHNPAIPMTVERSADQSGPATLSVFFADASARKDEAQSAAKKAAPAEGAAEREHVIDMKGKRSETILEEFTAAVKGQQVEPTEEESAELASLEQQREQSARDAEQVREVLKKQRREKMILEQAKKDAMR